MCLNLMPRLGWPELGPDGSSSLTDRLLRGTAVATATDRGVIRDVRDPEELRRGYNDLIGRAGALQAESGSGTGLPEVLVVPFPREVKELILGIAELDIDPFLVTAEGVAAIDGRIRLDAPSSQNRRMG